jgi:putative PIN family toxin of toxin-antitoxin system
VFDCVTLLQAAARPNGPPGACLQAVRTGDLELFLSPEIVAEVQDVLTRPKTLRKFPGLTPNAVALFLQDVLNRSVLLTGVPKAYTLARDPKDEPYIHLAIAMGAAYLVSRDKDLLDLMADADFRRDYPALTILDPPALLRELASQPAAPPDQEPEADPSTGSTP